MSKNKSSGRERQLQVDREVVNRPILTTKEKFLELRHTFKRLGIKLPTILLVPGYPRREGQRLIYQDGSECLLSDLDPVSKKPVSGSLKFPRPEGRP